MRPSAYNILLKAHGGAEAFSIVKEALPDLKSNEILLRQTAVGVNFHAIYVRSGLYNTLPLPGVPGIEAVGIVEAVGNEVGNVRVGDRIGYVSSSYGAYSSRRVLPSELAIALPDGPADIVLAGALMKMLTVCMLVREVHTLGAAETVLVHAAAGGVGQLLCSWAKALG